MSEQTKSLSLLLQQASRQLIPQFYRDLVTEKTAHIRQNRTLTKKQRKAEELVEAQKIFQAELKDFSDLGNEPQKELFAFFAEFLAANVVQPVMNRDHSVRKAKKGMANVAAVKEQIQITKALSVMDKIDLRFDARMNMTNAEIDQEVDSDLILTTATRNVQAIPTMSKAPNAVPVKEVGKDKLKACLEGAYLSTPAGRKLLNERAKQESEKTKPAAKGQKKAKERVKEDA